MSGQSVRSSNIPALERQVLALSGDVRPRPHANCYWLIPGRLLAGEHPGAVDTAEGIRRVDALLDAGVRHCIDLTGEREGPAPYARILLERGADRNLRVAHRRLMIRDFGVPSPALMRTTLDTIYDAMATGDAVYVHCLAGVGRTGTVVGCLLREQGLTAAEALAVIAVKWRSMEKRSRYPRSPESPGQFAFIEQWTAVINRG